jgi:putative endonuclease
MSSKLVGEKGEEIAVKYLKKKGYKIVERNYQSRIGEIDIIALDKNTLVFIEVKSRYSQRYGDPIEAVDNRKKEQISKMAKMYLNRKRLWHLNCRFDVVSIVFKENKPIVKILKDAFWIEESF